MEYYWEDYLLGVSQVLDAQDNMLNDLHKQQIKEWALKEPDAEICGLFYVSGDSTHIVKCKNIASNKREYFEIDPLQYLKISNNKKNKIVGFFHSQLELNQPSELDYMVANGHGCKSIIYCVKEDKFFDVENIDLKYIKYLYRDFKIGSNDCFGLVCDFYKNEYNIIINDYFRDEKWFEKNSKIIEENFEKEGFFEVDNFESIRNGDVILFSYKHMGIYLEKNLLLHAPYNRKSLVEKLNKSLIDRIGLILRHKNNK